ncbi:hypothetical protein [Streptomyces sp. NPDC051997]|uniref:hypothetical protein n=1 Tax=Streptomyces sp. NPDC051997 TaxID=3155611 RepID=UPI0034192B50
MNTAIAITAIIAATLLANSIVTAVRDVAQAKHKATACEQCTHNTTKETEA